MGDAAEAPTAVEMDRGDKPKNSGGRPSNIPQYKSGWRTGLKIEKPPAGGGREAGKPPKIKGSYRPLAGYFSLDLLPGDDTTTRRGRGAPRAAPQL